MKKNLLFLFLGLLMIFAVVALISAGGSQEAVVETEETTTSTSTDTVTPASTIQQKDFSSDGPGGELSDVDQLEIQWGLPGDVPVPGTY